MCGRRDGFVKNDTTVKTQGCLNSGQFPWTMAVFRFPSCLDCLPDSGLPSSCYSALHCLLIVTRLSSIAFLFLMMSSFWDVMTFSGLQDCVNSQCFQCYLAYLIFWRWYRMKVTWACYSEGNKPHLQQLNRLIRDLQQIYSCTLIKQLYILNLLYIMILHPSQQDKDQCFAENCGVLRNLLWSCVRNEESHCSRHWFWDIFVWKHHSFR